jgi:TPR repeat protein
MDMDRISMTPANPAAMDGRNTDAFYQLGMRHAADASAADRIEAHKWFNIAAIRGNAMAARLRREIAEEMSPAEIAAAQRAAREWITLH